MLQRLKVRLLQITGKISLGPNAGLKTQNSAGVESDIDLSVLDDVLTGSVVWDPASLVDGAGASQNVTVTGAVIGDFVMVGPGVDIVDMTVTAFVTAADTVTIRIQNESTATVNLASSTWNVIVFS